MCRLWISLLIGLLLGGSQDIWAMDWPQLQGKAGLELSRPTESANSDEAYERFASHLRWDGSVPFRVGRSRREVLYQLALRGWVTKKVPEPEGAGEEYTSEFLLEKAYVEYNRRRWRFRLGQQELVLGEVLGQSIIDLAHARDYRQADQFLKSTNRLPQLMGIIEYKRRRYGWQLFVSPQPEAMRLPKFLAKTPILTEFDQKEPEYGFRYNYFWQGLDLKFYGLHHQNRSPILVPELSSSGLRLRALQRYEKTVAGTFNYAWEYTVLRGELARTMADRQDPRDLSPVQVDQAILALDYTTEEQILLVGQLQSIVPYDCSLLPRCNQRQVWGGAQVQIPWWDSLFRTNFFLYQRLDQKTLYRRTDLEWDTGSNLQLRASHEFYEGFARDGLAFLDIQDRYLGEISYVF